MDSLISRNIEFSGGTGSDGLLMTPLASLSRRRSHRSHSFPQVLTHTTRISSTIVASQAASRGKAWSSRKHCRSASRKKGSSLKAAGNSPSARPSTATARKGTPRAWSTSATTISSCPGRTGRRKVALHLTNLGDRHRSAVHLTRGKRQPAAHPSPGAGQGDMRRIGTGFPFEAQRLGCVLQGLV